MRTLETHDLELEMCYSLLSSCYKYYIIPLMNKYLPWDEFDAMFRRFEQYAFRLETLPQYLVQCEREQFNNFLTGQPLLEIDQGYEGWLKMIRDTVASGRSISRVHLWPEKLTPYLRFELQEYAYNAAAGDEIRLLLPSAPVEVRALCKEDFWLFDDKTVAIVDYSADGTVLGARLLEDNRKLADYVATMRITMEHATPIRKYFSLIRSGELAG